jgi:hypothetical protein
MKPSVECTIGCRGEIRRFIVWSLGEQKHATANGRGQPAVKVCGRERERVRVSVSVSVSVTDDF